MRKVKEFMNDAPLSCGEEESIQSVANQMGASNIGFMPVVDLDKKIIGILTDRDICLTLGRGRQAANEVKVKEVMKKNGMTVTAEDDVKTALKIMRTKQVSRLPVVDSGNCLSGVISLTDIVRGITGQEEKEDLGYKGEENILSTLHAIAVRDEEQMFA